MYSHIYETYTQGRIDRHTRSCDPDLVTNPAGDRLAHGTDVFIFNKDMKNPPSPVTSFPVKSDITPWRIEGPPPRR